MTNVYSPFPCSNKAITPAELKMKILILLKLQLNYIFIIIY